MREMLTGFTETHLCSAADAAALGAAVHRDVVAPFHALRRDARDAGFSLRILSGFRSFDRQRAIWNDKVTGNRPVLDTHAVPVDAAALGERELVMAILRWSALPGASRHHWGTDLDVYDAAATPEGYEIELIPEEVNPGGMFGPLHAWLDERIASGRAFGFFRPYDVDRGGVAPERWHLSYGPLAASFLEQLTSDVLRHAIEQAEVRLDRTIVDNLDEIYERFVININHPAA